jgi:hypothetical protein
MRGVVAVMVVVSWVSLAGQRGGGGQPGPAAPPRQAAPVDLTGNWVSVVTEDWQWRMVTPARGDYASLPLNAAGTKSADQWSPAEEGSCRAFGAAAIMRVPGRLRISWETDDTLKIETDAGTQTRRLRFNAPPPAGARDLQGYSAARWELSNPALSAGTARGGTAAQAVRTWGSLTVVTTNMSPGWLRKNGVPYSENAVMTEHFDRFSDGTDEWFTVTTIVEDPTYLTQPLVVSSNFKKERDGSKWNPTTCR